MSLIPHQAKYLAYELTKRSASSSMEKLAGAVSGAQVTLNPHQVDAALFAFKSPLSKGALLADEVGLGKTIEAGLVISQRWAERKRRILVITPSNLRKQWHQELSEKFYLPCEILEAKSYNAAISARRYAPFEVTNKIVICSYQFARNKAPDVARTEWDLVVIDEAHRLRNVYKPTNKVANTLKGVLENRPKILLTATPLQNSLLELYGLVGFVDDQVFGDLRSYREQYANLSHDDAFRSLKNRLATICHRTLRRQVTAHVSYTKRFPIVEAFNPEQTEEHLYKRVSEYLQRDDLAALPPAQRTLMTLVLRKLLASSTFAIAGALETMAQRLRDKILSAQESEVLQDSLSTDYEAFEETAEEWEEENPSASITAEERVAIECEIKELEEFARLAKSIQTNGKGKALLTALNKGFAELKRLGAAPKAIIFTESRKTQEYLLKLLADTEWGAGIVLFNGTNTDKRSGEIYAEWLKRHKGSDRVTGSRSADMRSALVDYFKEQGSIMIATEAGAEGINLQFCSLVVNYDLPWNPQRVEQRIGRCHRYGQKHDVVVINFLNSANAADARVYELLSEKFKLFEGVFGASDEVLGAVESGVDFEKRIAAIYQECRAPEEIKQAFDELQLELRFEINETLTQTRQKLLENFDDEVIEKLRISDSMARTMRSRFEEHLMRLAQHTLGDSAKWDEASTGFELLKSPFPDTDILTGKYDLPRHATECHAFRIGHPLAEAILNAAKSEETSSAAVTFAYSSQPNKVSVFDKLKGTGGWLTLTKLTIESLGQAEDYFILSVVTDSGKPLVDIPEDCRRLNEKLLLLPVGNRELLMDSPPVILSGQVQAELDLTREEVSHRTSRDFEAEVQKLDQWADDQKVSLERDIKEFDRLIREARRAATTQGLALNEKVAAQRRVRELEAQRNTKRRELFDAQDRIDAKRGELIGAVEAKLVGKEDCETIFTLRWHLA